MLGGDDVWFPHPHVWLPMGGVLAAVTGMNL